MKKSKSTRVSGKTEPVVGASAKPSPKKALASGGWTDKDRLEFLEAEVRKNGPLLIHNAIRPEGPEWQGYRGRGLGLLPHNPRTLREAIDSMACRSKVKSDSDTPVFPSPNTEEQPL